MHHKRLQKRKNCNKKRININLIVIFIARLKMQINIKRIYYFIYFCIKTTMNYKQLKIPELVRMCNDKEITQTSKKKSDLIKALEQWDITEIEKAKENNTDLDLLKDKIHSIVNCYSDKLKEKISIRQTEMTSDNKSHYLIYNLLGITSEEGKLIDEYQNTGRFLYKYAGSFLEEVSSLCFKFKNPYGGKKMIPNSISEKPKNFEIDFLDNNNALEIKWRDATTDGDHITKEHTRIKAIVESNYIPIRIMFYYPQREQAKKIQSTLNTLYKGVDGQYYAGDEAWNFVSKNTGYNLKEILTDIAKEKKSNSEN